MYSLGSMMWLVRYFFVSQTVLLLWSGDIVTHAIHWPSISIVVPTCYFRHKFHSRVISMFQHQTYLGDMELIVHDGACGKTNSFKSALSYIMIEAADKDPRIKYYFDKQTSRSGRGEVMTIGAKRNFLLNKVATALVANFDDDDYYSPHYVEEMVTHLIQNDADMIKLNGWFTYGIAKDITIEGENPLGLWYSDFSETNYIGWGWSLVFKIQLFGEFSYSDLMEGEEDKFVSSVEKSQYKLHHFGDENFIALRIVTQSVVRATGIPPPVSRSGKKICNRYHIPIFYLPKGYGETVEPWLRMWNFKE